MASLLSRVVASFAAIAPVPNLTGLDGEFTQLDGASGALNGNTTAFKLLIKTSDAADPPVDLDQVGAGPILRLKQNTVTKITFNNNGTVTFVNTAVNPGLNADQVDGVEGANIAKLDTHKSRFSVTWFYPVLPGAVESVESVGRLMVPKDVVEMKIDIIYVGWAAGADSLASNVFTIKRRNAAGTLQADIGTIDVNNAAQNAPTQSDVADVTCSVGDQIYPLFTTRNTASEQLVSVTVAGWQKFGP